MRLSSMRYKNYTWPHNPETFVVEYRRQMAAYKVPLGGCVLQDLGVNCRILRGPMRNSKHWRRCFRNRERGC